MECNNPVCNNDVPIMDGFFVAEADGSWRFYCEECEETPGGIYPVPVRDIFKSPFEMIDFLHQISEKTWFSKEKFFNFIGQVWAWGVQDKSLR